MTEDKSKEGMSYWVWLPPVLIPVYVFSIFPVACIFKYSGASCSSVNRMFEILYAPVIWAMKNVEVFGDFMNGIADFFGL